MRDTLSDRLSRQEREELVQSAQSQGEAAAAWVHRRFPRQQLEEICGAYGAAVVRQQSSDGCGLYLFGRFEEPDTVYLYEQTIYEVQELMRQWQPDAYFPVERLVLAHELYHVLELQEREIPHQHRTVPILKFGRLALRRRLHAPSEIAAMSFAQKLLGSDLNPQFLDVLALYAKKDPAADAYAAYIFRISGRKAD